MAGRPHALGRGRRMGRLLLFLTLTICLVPASAASAAWPGKNGRVVWTSGGDLWSDAGRLTATAQEEAQATWSPHSFELAYTVRHPGATPDVIQRVYPPGDAD